MILARLCMNFAGSTQALPLGYSRNNTILEYYYFVCAIILIRNSIYPGNIYQKEGTSLNLHSDVSVSQQGLFYPPQYF